MKLEAPVGDDREVQRAPTGGAGCSTSLPGTGAEVGLRGGGVRVAAVARPEGERKREE